MRRSLTFFLVLALATTALAQHDHTPPAAPPEPPVTLDPGVGSTHYPVTTHNAEAQKFFDQGLRYLYAFNHDESARSFRRAIELDPEMAMSYWGLGLILGPNINFDVDPDREKAAFDAVQNAKLYASHATQKERDLIDALAKRYTNNPDADLKALAVDYSKAMGEVHAKYPDDLDVATLYAESKMDLHPWNLWRKDGTPEEGTEEIVRTLESVLARNPQHIGANHYYIHTVEASPHPEKALASAERLKTLAPAASHLVHMPAHIQQRTGRYAGAALANERAAALDRTYMAKKGPQNFYGMYNAHNLMFGAASYGMEGRYTEAARLADELATNLGPMASSDPMMGAAMSVPVTVRVRFGRWIDVIRMPQPNAGPYTEAVWHFARASAFAAAGNVPGAERERAALDALVPKLDGNEIFFNPMKDLIGVASQLTAGRIAEAKGDTDAALSAYRGAVASEDALHYNEPADWFYPTRETLGGALLRAGRAGEAEAVFREDLRMNPGNPRSLFGVAEALKMQGKSAARERAQLARAWRGGTLTVGAL